MIFCFTLINNRFDLRPAEGGVKSVDYQKEVAARPLKIRFNPHDPHNPRPHPPTGGVAEQILRTHLMMYLKSITPFSL